MNEFRSKWKCCPECYKCNDKLIMPPSYCDCYIKTQINHNHDGDDDDDDDDDNDDDNINLRRQTDKNTALKFLISTERDPLTVTVINGLVEGDPLTVTVINGLVERDPLTVTVINGLVARDPLTVTVINVGENSFRPSMPATSGFCEAVDSSTLHIMDAKMMHLKLVMARLIA
uniref:Uncharacterized protein n=1 Tax=Glossina austeni TaxID=7395 RepID=A0A1A9VFF3_GLOAU